MRMLLITNADALFVSIMIYLSLEYLFPTIIMRNSSYYVQISYKKHLISSVQRSLKGDLSTKYYVKVFRQKRFENKMRLYFLLFSKDVKALKNTF